MAEPWLSTVEKLSGQVGVSVYFAKIHTLRNWPLKNL